MSAPPPSSSILAPLQRVMLATSAGGAHIEQVEMRFSEEVPPARILSAWHETVAETAALRVAFSTDGRGDWWWQWATVIPVVTTGKSLPDPWRPWLEQDRQQEILTPETAPWRAVFWPHAGRFVWTFHHALLDGRSVTQILRGFLDRVAGKKAPPLGLSKWQTPSQLALSAAGKMFREEFASLETINPMLSAHSQNEGRAQCSLGVGFLKRLSSGETTVATQVIWAWGQALLENSTADAVAVEQLRAGAPQEGTAGFTMNTLPLLIRRADQETILDFRERLLALRDIEGISPRDFPPGVFPDMDRPGSSVIMVEHGTLAYQIGAREVLKSLVMHEPKAETRIATAHLLPDLTLEVEGPGRHEALAAWVRTLERKVS